MFKPQPHGFKSRGRQRAVLSLGAPRNNPFFAFSKQDVVLVDVSIL